MVKRIPSFSAKDVTPDQAYSGVVPPSNKNQRLLKRRSSRTKTKENGSSEKAKIRRVVKVEQVFANASIPTSNSNISSSHRLLVTTGPTPEEYLLAVHGLTKLHPEVVKTNLEIREKALQSYAPGGDDLVTDGIISTMLSQNTTAANSTEAFRRLKQEFPTWQDVVDLEGSDLSKLENSIKIAGLAKIRSERIHNLLCVVQKEQQEQQEQHSKQPKQPKQHPKQPKQHRDAVDAHVRRPPSFGYLKDLTDQQIKTELTRFKGLGPKTISCVLLFHLVRPEFPVDTHVLRISKLLHWVPSSATRESAYELLNASVPADLKMDLHSLLVTHGKHCHNCAANHKPQFRPKDGTKLVCPLLAMMRNKKGTTGLFLPTVVAVGATKDIVLKKEKQRHVIKALIKKKEGISKRTAVKKEEVIPRKVGKYVIPRKMVKKEENCV